MVSGRAAGFDVDEDEPGRVGHYAPGSYSWEGIARAKVRSVYMYLFRRINLGGGH